jgi:hypothetical protein
MHMIWPTHPHDHSLSHNHCIYIYLHCPNERLNELNVIVCLQLFRFFCVCYHSLFPVGSIG